MPSLLAVVGPTAVGKTEVAIQLAQHFNTEIISADSRQFYKELNIGVARPTEEQLATVPHHFIKCRSVTEPYSAGQYADDALDFLEEYFNKNSRAILVGGSGLYVQAVCKGFDNVPPSDQHVRQALNARHDSEGLQPLLNELSEADPDYFNEVDRANPRRILRALEVFEITGKPFSLFRNNAPVPRAFDVCKIGLRVPAKELEEKIHGRVDQMIEQGLLSEAQSILVHRNLAALHAVGYQELFEHLEGKTSISQAVDLIKLHTTQFAKRQMTWWRKDDSINWFEPGDLADIVAYVQNWLDSSSKPTS